MQSFKRCVAYCVATLIVVSWYRAVEPRYLWHRGIKTTVLVNREKGVPPNTTLEQRLSAV